MLRANKSIEEFGPIFDALGLLDTSDPEPMKAHMRGAQGGHRRRRRDQRRSCATAIELKNYEFNAHGVELGQRYRSAAVVPRRDARSPTFTRDPELYYHPTTWPGARLPHVLARHATGRSVSTHDLAGKGRFALLTGIGGEAGSRRRGAVAASTGVEIAAYVIGPGRDVHRHSTTTGRAPARSRRPARARAPRRPRRVAQQRAAPTTHGTALQGVFERLLGGGQS